MFAIGSIAGVVAFIIGLFTPLDPFWRTVWLVAALAYLAVVMAIHYRAILFAGADRFFPGHATRLRGARQTEDLIPLLNAARQVYEATIGNRVGDHARTISDGTPEGILNYCANLIITKGTPIFAQRLPSTIAEPVPNPRRANLDCTAVESDAGDEYNSPSVKASDIKNLITELSRVH